MASRPRLTIDIREKDLGLGHLLREAAKIRKRPFVKVGVTQARGSKLHVVEDENGKAIDQKMTVADIAQIHEFGAPSRKIPERSFIRSTVDKNRAKYGKHLQELFEHIFNPSGDMTTERALGIMGQEITSDIKNTIRKRETTGSGDQKLSPKTILRKNRRIIEAAHATVRKMQAKVKLTAGDKKKLFGAQATIDTGGESTPLIDTGQLINSINYEVVLAGEGDSSYSGEGPKTY